MSEQQLFVACKKDGVQHAFVPGVGPFRICTVHHHQVLLPCLFSSRALRSDRACGKITNETERVTGPNVGGFRLKRCLAGGSGIDPSRRGRPRPVFVD